MRERLRIRTRLIRRGRQTVILTYPGLRLGNYLYFALQAYIASRQGRELRVLDTGLGAEWYDVFPRLRELTVRRLGPFDRRKDIPPRFYQAYGHDFSPEELAGFVRDVLALDLPPSFSDDTLTINIRRGDYYDSADRARAFGFDVVSYLKLAFDRAETDGPITQVLVVSDDVDWAAAAVAAARPDRDSCQIIRGAAPEHLITLARSPRLILANSTFSYWGAYLSDAVHGQSRVYAPDFHVRGTVDGRPWQHAPSWIELETAPAALT